MEVKKQNIGRGASHGKIILMGEHSVVYGYPAIAIPFLATIINVKVSKIEDDCIFIDSKFYKGPLVKAPKEIEHVSLSIEHILDQLKIEDEDKRIRIDIESDLPSARGMGSSAAVVVAITRAIYDYYGISLSKYKLIEHTDFGEQLAHGNPSGIDTRATAFDEAIIYVRGMGVTEIELDIGAYLIVADTGFKGKTKDAVGMIRRQYDADSGARQLISKLGKYAERAEEAIRSKDVDLVGDLMYKAHYTLDRLGVSHPLLNELVKKAKEKGALGAKMTGGGLGGCMIVLVDDYDKALLIASELEKTGAINTWIHYMKAQKN